MSIDWDALVLGPCMAIFGEGAAHDAASWPTYMPAAGGAFQLEGAVYDEEYTRVVDLGDGTQSTTTHPVLGVRDALFAAQGLRAAQGDKVFIPSIARTLGVADTQQDGHGHTLLILIKLVAA